MYRRFGATLIGGLLLAACSGNHEEPARETRARAATDTAAVPVGGHGTHAMRDSAAADSEGSHAAHGGGVGMSHADAAPGGQQTHMGGHASTAGTASDHGPDHGRMDHEQSRGTGGVGSRTAGRMDHNAHSGGASSAATSHPSTGHSAGHGVVQAQRRDGATMAGAHAAHVGAPRENTGRAPMRHGGTGAHPAGHGQAHAGTPTAGRNDQARASAPHAAGHGQPPTLGSLPPGEGTEKLLTLVRELVQDSVVQERIEDDPVLRETWADPGVRRVVLQRP